MMKKISIIFPTYNEEASIDLLYESMLKVIADNSHYEWEFLIINDGSSDNTLNAIKELHLKDKRFNYLDLSRNYGKEIAMFLLIRLFAALTIFCVER